MITVAAALGVAIKPRVAALRNHPGGSIISEAPRFAFSEACRIYQSDMETDCFPNLDWELLPPASGPHPSLRARREDHALPIVLMSSDRLFLDRVGRHQSPSPLHRQAQTNTHFPAPCSKPDISTLRRIGHFYFAPTS
jgi:hypothetical protein